MLFGLLFPSDWKTLVREAEQKRVKHHFWAGIHSRPPSSGIYCIGYARRYIEILKHGRRGRLALLDDENSVRILQPGLYQEPVAGSYTRSPSVRKYHMYCVGHRISPYHRNSSQPHFT